MEVANKFAIIHNLLGTYPKRVQAQKKENFLLSPGICSHCFTDPRRASPQGGSTLDKVGRRDSLLTISRVSKALPLKKKKLFTPSYKLRQMLLQTTLEKEKSS